jgi:hypothetical protein
VYARKQYARTFMFSFLVEKWKKLKEAAPEQTVVQFKPLESTLTKIIAQMCEVLGKVKLPLRLTS